MNELVGVALLTDDVEAVERFNSELVGVEPEDDWAGGRIVELSRR